MIIASSSLTELKCRCAEKFSRIVVAIVRHRLAAEKAIEGCVTFPHLFFGLEEGEQ
jgi:hypothetical protein